MFSKNNISDKKDLDQAINKPMTVELFNSLPPAKAIRMIEKNVARAKKRINNSTATHATLRIFTIVGIKN